MVRKEEEKQEEAILRARGGVCELDELVKKEDFEALGIGISRENTETIGHLH